MAYTTHLQRPALAHSGACRGEADVLPQEAGGHGGRHCAPRSGLKRVLQARIKVGKQAPVHGVNAAHLEGLVQRRHLLGRSLDAIQKPPTKEIQVN